VKDGKRQMDHFVVMNAKEAFVISMKNGNATITDAVQRVATSAKNQCNLCRALNVITGPVNLV
jgi:hypothetical protein